MVGGDTAAPAVAEGGIITMLLMPWNDALVMVGPWHSAQLVVMPVPWLKADLLNLAVLGIGKVRLLVEPTWQLSQLCPRIGTCLLASGPTTARMALLL